MNKAYKVIWSKVRNCYIVVSELAKRHTKAPSVSSVKGVVAFVTAAATLSVMLGGYGVAWASEDNFKNFRRGYLLENTASEWLQNDEFNNSTGLHAISAENAYALGYSGAGITIGIVDTPIDTTHREFKDRNNILFSKISSQNYVFDSENYDSGTVKHGTHVAGIMVANLDDMEMQGVAYNGKLSSVGHDGNDESVKGKYFSLLDENVKVVNNSWSKKGFWRFFTNKELINNVENDIKTNDRVYVFTAGNEGQIDIEDRASGVLDESEIIKKNLINVVSYDVGNNQYNISYFSNLAKGAEKNTITAPGSTSIHDGIYSTVANNGYDKLSGTSMASPYVTGTVGLVQEAFPYLSGKQLVDVILTTANNDFTMPEYVVLKNSDYHVVYEGFLNWNFAKFQNDGINIIYFSDSFNDSDAHKREILGAFFDENGEYNEQAREVRLLGLNRNSFIEWSLNNLKVKKYTREEAYGQGILDVGKAVKGIGAIDVARLTDDDSSSAYGLDKTYLYKVNTGKAEDNFHHRDYSIWSNDIEEKNTFGTGMQAGILKSGDVDLVLLGVNTYQGPTVVTGGHLQIVRQVQGDVYVGSSSGATAEINGSAENVYALRKGEVKITDTITQKEYSSNVINEDFENVNFYNEIALPETHAVNIDGGLFAIGKNTISNEGSTIDVNLRKSDSVIKGPVYQDELSKINVELSNNAKLIVEQGNGYYDGSTYVGNNKLNNLTLTGLGEVDLSQDYSYTTLNIEKLSGNHGRFIVGTDINNNQADVISVKNATDTQSHYMSVREKSGLVLAESNEGKSVKVAETPSTVTFEGYPLIEDKGVWQSQYAPKIDYLNSGNGRKDWYFYGFDGTVTKPEVDSIITQSGIYTTDSVLNFGIYAPNSTLKVIQATSPAMIVNRKEKHESGKPKDVTGILGSVNFVGNGPVKLVVDNQSKGGVAPSYGEIQYYYNGRQKGNTRTTWVKDSAFTAGLSNRHVTNTNDEYNFSANQDFEIDLTFQNGEAYGIYTVEKDEDTNKKLNNSITFNGNLTINLHHPESTPYNVKAIQNVGNFDVKGDTKIDMDVDTTSLNDYEGNVVKLNEAVAIDNSGNFNVNGDVDINMKGADNSYRRSFTGIRNTNSLSVGGKTNINIEVDNVTKCAAISNVDGNIEFKDSVKVDVRGYFYNDVVNNESQKQKATMIFDKDLNIISDDTIHINNGKESDMTVRGLITTDSSKYSNIHIYVKNEGELTAGGINTDVIDNQGKMIINGNVNADSLENGENGIASIAGKSEIGKVLNDGTLEFNSLNANSVESSGTLIIGGNTDINRELTEGSAVLLDISNGNAEFDGNVNLNLDGNNNTLYTVTGLALGPSSVAKVHGDLNIEVENVYDVSDGVTALSLHTEYYRGDYNNELLVDGDINITIPNKYGDFGSDSGKAIHNAGIIKAKNIITNSYIGNSGQIEVQNNIQSKKLVNAGDIIIGNAGTFESVTNNGNITAKSIVADYWERDDCGTGVIDSLTVNEGIDYTFGNYEIENLVIKKGGVNFASGSKINQSGSGNVMIEGNVSLNSGFINLTNPNSYLKGKFEGEEGARLSIANGAQWNVPGNTYILSSLNKSLVELNNNGIIKIGMTDSYETSGIRLNTLSGTGGIFAFDIAQKEANSGEITSGYVLVDKNLTKNAKHTIRLTPKQADFALTNNVEVKPFELVHDYSECSEDNKGYLLNFSISPFDAGVYNYTPTLTSKKDNSNVNIWQVTDIKRTGSASPVNPDPVNPDPVNPDPVNPDPVNPDNPSTGEGVTKPADPNQSDAMGVKKPSDPVPSGSGLSNEIAKNIRETTTSVFRDETVHAVVSNLTKNTLANSVNNYVRLRDEYNNLDKRLGDLRYSNEDNGLWARMFRGREESGKYGLNSTYNAFQIGYDRKLKQKNGGQWFVGGAVTSYDGKTTFDNAGKTENKSIGLALYGSYLGSKGHYVDIVARHSHMRTDLTSYATGTGAKITGDYHNWGSSFGVEYGRRVALKNGYYVQPQAELIYGHVNGGGYDLDDGSHVSQSSVSSWTARGGISLGRQTDKGSVYATLSVLHDFGGDSSFEITDKYGGAYRTDNNFKDTWYELNIGGNAKLNKNTYIYADVERTFGGDIKTKWRYNVGLRHSF